MAREKGINVETLRRMVAKVEEYSESHRAHGLGPVEENRFDRVEESRLEGLERWMARQSHGNDWQKKRDRARFLVPIGSGLGMTVLASGALFHHPDPFAVIPSEARNPVPSLRLPFVIPSAAKNPALSLLCPFPRQPKQRPAQWNRAIQERPLDMR